MTRTLKVKFYLRIHNQLCKIHMESGNFSIVDNTVNSIYTHMFRPNELEHVDIIHSSEGMFALGTGNVILNVNVNLGNDSPSITESIHVSYINKVTVSGYSNDEMEILQCPDRLITCADKHTSRYRYKDCEYSIKNKDHKGTLDITIVNIDNFGMLYDILK